METSYENRAIKVQVISDRKVIATHFDSFDSIESVVNFVEANYPSATDVSVTDLNDTDFFKNRKVNVENNDE